jgi:hypothetical protein
MFHYTLFTEDAMAKTQYMYNLLTSLSINTASDTSQGFNIQQGEKDFSSSLCVQT